LDLLLKNGAVVDDKTLSAGYTALHYAAFYGNREAVYLLLNKGAKARDFNENTAFHAACWKKHFTVASDLLLFGHTPNDKNVAGHSALHLACMKKDKDSIEYLLKQGSSPNAKDEFGNLPLFYALHSQDKSIIRLFAEATDCDWTLKNNKGQSVFHLAVLQKSMTLLDFLFTLKKPIMTKFINEADWILNRTPLHYSIMDFDKITSVTSFLCIQPEINLNLQDTAGDTALHLAVKLENAHGARLLMFGTTPANMELKNGEKVTVKSLLKQKPEFSARLKDKKRQSSQNIMGSGDTDDHIKL
jgi:ankyrin repeat protein